MSLATITEARRDAVRAKARLERTLAAVQHRLSPGNLAEEAWDGVKDKSADLAEGALHAVKSRPKAVSLALGAFALFLARAPLKRAVSRLISGGGDEDGNDKDDAELSVQEGVS
jgi:hypothetical protein